MPSPASQRASPTPSQHAEDEPEDDLSSVAWWTTESLEFGIIPEAPQDPNPPVSPGGFRQLAIGTLDGRVTALLALHTDWGHSYVAGPYGTDVLVANDIGEASEVFLISARDGTRTDLFRSEDRVAAAALGADGGFVYYLEVGRADGRDRGLLRRPVAGGEPEIVVAGPIGPVEPGPAVHWLTAAPLAAHAVVQSCFGEIRCTSVIVDLETRQARSLETLGWPLGAGKTQFFSDGLEASGATAVDLVSGGLVTIPSESAPVQIDGQWRFVTGIENGPTTVRGLNGEREIVPGEEPDSTAIMTLGERRGVSLPDGWVVRWPPLRLWEVDGASGPPGGPGQLIDLATGRRFDLAVMDLAVTQAPDCAVPTPLAMPDGRRPGTGVVELIGGFRSVRWGPREEAVIAVIGRSDVAGPGKILAEAPATIRGQGGRASIVQSPAGERPALAWSEEGCEYLVWLPSPMTLEEIVAYAEAY
ncbi:MAG TPA: hypothetical protein VFP30_06400 [Candidatus Limnocylindria bacterium]|nr:hypothetical protein [Candidatus Limnocylindria bacterium]